MKRHYWILLAVFALFGLLPDIILAENFEVIETWQGYKIKWDAPRDTKAKIEIPAFCLEYNKDLPPKGTSYELALTKKTPILANIFKTYRILKENYALRREFLMQDDTFGYLLKEAILASMMRESEKVRQEMATKPEIDNTFIIFIKSCEELLSPKVLRVAVQQAIWCEREGITVYDLQKRVLAEGRDFNPDLQALVNLSLFTIAPYTQLILETSGSEKLWIKPEDKLNLKKNPDALADTLIIHNEFEELLDVLERPSNIKDRCKKAYAWFELGDAQKAWSYLDIEFQQNDLENVVELRYFKTYLKDRKRFDILYQSAINEIRSNRLEEAKRYLINALELLPYNPDAKYILGLIDYNQGNKKHSLKLWKEVTEETPLFMKLNFEARLARIACLREAGRYKEMWKEYKELEKKL